MHVKDGDVCGTQNVKCSRLPGQSRADMNEKWVSENGIKNDRPLSPVFSPIRSHDLFWLTPGAISREKRWRFETKGRIK